MKLERSKTNKPVMFEKGNTGNGIGMSQVITDCRGGTVTPISIARKGSSESHIYNGVFRVYPRMKVLTLERAGMKASIKVWEIVSVISEGEFRLITEYKGDISSVWRDGNDPTTLGWSPRPLWESFNPAVTALLKASFTTSSMMCYWRKRAPRRSK